jgi:hypothetical protein
MKDAQIKTVSHTERERIKMLVIWECHSETQRESVCVRVQAE